MTRVRPMEYVGADGPVASRAYRALVVIRKDGSLAPLMADPREGRVAGIATISVTLIEK